MKAQEIGTRKTFEHGLSCWEVPVICCGRKVHILTDSDFEDHCKFIGADLSGEVKRLDREDILPLLLHDQRSYLYLVLTDTGYKHVSLNEHCPPPDATITIAARLSVASTEKPTTTLQ